MAAAESEEKARIEASRLSLLYDLELLDTAPEEAFDSLTELAAELCGRPTSLVSLVGEHRQYFKSRHGTDLTETARDISFCSYAIESSVQELDIFEVPDTHLDGRFRSNPLVTGDPHIRHYAGVPLRPTGGLAVGTLCVIGPESGRLDERQRRVLVRLGSLVEQLLRLRLIAKMEATAHDRAEKSEQHYRYLAENTADMVLVHDEDLNVRYISPNVREFLGYGPDEMWSSPGGRPVLTEEDNAILRSAVQSLTADQPTISTRVRGHRKDGSVTDVEVYTRAIFVNDEAVEFQSSARDIGHIVAYEEELKEANLKLQGMVDERTRLISGIAHDLAAPLAAIRVTAESLTSQLTEEPMVEQASRLEGFAQSAEAFASDLRSMIEPESAGYTLSPRQIQVRPVVERAIAQVAHVPDHNLSTFLDDVEAFADPQALSRITTNLLINANRHTPPGTPIEISLTASDDSVTLRVADGGPGIPIELRSLVLEPYVTTSSTGSGLGLAISKALVEGLDGQLYISDNEPRGTVVSATFPATSANSARSSAAAG